MTDASDKATERECELRSDALAEVARMQRMPSTGRCYNCDGEISKGNFCDVYCREDFEKLSRLIKQKGRK